MYGQTSSPHGTERVTLGPSGDGSGKWWDAYKGVLGRSGLGSTSLGVVDDDAEYIVGRCVLGPGAPSASTWPVSRLRRGAVMGGVQSGKTASMMAVAAKALDQGVDAIVVLAGTRTALWLQTWERVLDQLDTLPHRSQRRVFLPSRAPSSVEARPAALGTLYSITPQLASRAMQKSRPIIAVVMKQVAHLEQLGRTLHEVVYPALADRAKPFHLLVIDDEADDSSIADAVPANAISTAEKQVPRRIVDLWESRRTPGQTAHEQLFATYLAYTATPQANFLQDESNPLYPTDFVVSLRTPGPEGVPEVRSSSYRVSEGVRGWYTGGEIYYKVLEPVPLCVPTDGLDVDDLLVNAVRGFLVSSALRLWRQPEAAGPSRAQKARFETLAAAKQALAPPMSMLVHPSFAKDEHFARAGEILAWAAGRSPADGALMLAQGQRLLSAVGVEEDMRLHVDKWLEWVDSFVASAEACRQLLGLHKTPLVADRAKWLELRRSILEEIVPGTAVAVINSDEVADDRPGFTPVQDGEGWRAPRNMSTIFVSGNVMSRGLTLEGLSMTLFTRASDEPAADTQMQMQRWFGYRGSYIDLCRVLMSKTQISLFTRYHEVDEALRRDILGVMASGETPKVSVLQGGDFRATGKVRGVLGSTVWPGPASFMRYMNKPEDDLDNQELIASLFVGPSLGVPDDGARQGLLLEESYSLGQAAELLDRLRYRHHGAREDGSDASRWGSIANHAGLVADDPLRPLFRAPTCEDSVDVGSASPYAVAAYLRFWAACLERRVPGVVSTDEPPVLWSLVDLAVRREKQPRFRIGLRFGEQPPAVDGPLAKLSVPVRPMKRTVRADGSLDGSWGSHNMRGGEAWGDEFFDHYRSGRYPEVTPSRSRVAGSQGLILFHVVDRSPGVSMAVGYSLPVGGPDQVHAVPNRRR
jgi:hypothetical protein